MPLDSRRSLHNYSFGLLVAKLSDERNVPVGVGFTTLSAVGRFAVIRLRAKSDYESRDGDGLTLVRCNHFELVAGPPISARRSFARPLEICERAEFHRVILGGKISSILPQVRFFVGALAAIPPAASQFAFVRSRLGPRFQNLRGRVVDAGASDCLVRCDQGCRFERSCIDTRRRGGNTQCVWVESGANAKRERQ